MKTRVKVKRAALIKVVEGRLRKAENEHKRAVAAYGPAITKWEADCVAKLEKSLADAKRGKIPTDRYDNPQVLFPTKPSRPSEGRATCNLRRLLKTLQMGSDETMWLSEDDADDYFGPCKT